jgi:hypothetical protein
MKQRNNNNGSNRSINTYRTYRYVSRHTHRAYHLELVVALRQESVNEDGQTLLLLEGGQNILQQLQVTVPEVLNGIRE